jgi:hypothetical protein
VRCCNAPVNVDFPGAGAASCLDAFDAPLSSLVRVLFQPHLSCRDCSRSELGQTTSLQPHGLLELDVDESALMLV